MKKISRVINLLPCPRLDDFPTHHQGQDAESLLANWTAAWHPELIAATGSRPLWCSTEQTASQANADPSDPIDSAESEIEETDPYLSDLYSADESIDQKPAGAHGGPHAPLPYDGSPFRLPVDTNNQSSQSNDDDLEPSNNPLWTDSVLLIPTVSTSSLHEEFAASAAASSAAMVAGQIDRDEIAKRLTAVLGLRTDEVTKHWANEFYAVGYAWLQVQLLTRKIRYSSNLNQKRFDSALIQSARAVVSNDYDAAEVELTTCYDTLMEEKNNYYPVKPDLIELVLTSPKTLGKSFETEVESTHPSNFQMTGDTIKTLAQRSPGTTELLRQRLADRSASLVGGNQFELPAPLLSQDSALNQILQNAETAKRLLETEPKIFLRRRAGLTSDLPLMLEQLDFDGALHMSFDRGRIPVSSPGTIAWAGPCDSSIMAKTEIPLDASDAATFLDFSVQFGKQLDSAHSATMMLVHWPGKTQSTFHDLVRISSRSPVLGTFQTLENHFGEIYDPGYGDTFLPDEYRPEYLKEAVRKGACAPISSIASYWARTWRVTYLAHWNTWIALASHAADNIDQDRSTTCEAVVDRIQEVQRALEQDTESWQPPTPEIDSQIDEIEQSIVQLFRKAYISQSDPNQDTDGAVLLNPLGFRRRIFATTSQGNTDESANFTDSQKPFQFSAVDSDKTGRRWVMNVDSFCAAPIEIYPKAVLSDGRRAPAVLGKNQLQNEFFVANIDDSTGGLRSIQFHGKRGNRGGQRIVYHDHTRPKVSSQMVCRSIASHAESKLDGLITTEGIILMEGQEVADFKQRFRLMRGQRYLQLEIELTPKISLPSSTATWFANQLAWQDEACSLHAACQLAKYEAVDPQIQSPSFVEISMTDYSLTLLAGGLPFHRRTARCKLDTMLIVGQEQQRTFRLGIGVNITHAARAASHFGSPPYQIKQLPVRSVKKNTFHQCLVHLDCKNIITTFAAPVYSDGKLVAVRLRLQETEGRAGRLHISTPLSLEKAKRQNLLGHTVATLKIDDNRHRVGIDFSRNDFFQVELQF